MSKATTISNEVAIATIVDVLRLRAETQRDEIAYRFLADGEEERDTLTYGELYRRARQVAGELQKQSAVGQRALLLDSSEADYIVAFCGCLCAGVIAVPIYAPRVNKKGNARVESVVADAQPSVVLTTGAGSPAVRDVVAASAGEQVKWIDTNALPVDGDELWTPPAVSGTDIAFLQYTSGSTAAPKGVMVSHANILHNERMIQNAFDTTPGSVIVGWLPLYHDMGLIGNVLQPLFAGVPCILMSPVAFLQRPLRWLQAISRYQATTSGGPNFAYELCMRKIRPEDRAGLDLSSWRVAFNGAEPVRLETVNRFAAQFADCGFRRAAFVPCYGLAEATLFVSGGLDPNGVTAVNYGVNGDAKNGGSGNGAKISRKQDKLLVACGRPPGEQTVRIVSPDSLRQCSAGDVGEIWISGPSVAQGYWRKAKETEETFNARIPEIDEGPFLRTGDLGFLKDGHLFITGRLKDLLIIRGQNYYPQDIELTVEQSHPILQPGSGAAFSVEIEGEERLVVVQEVVVRKDPESIVQSDLDELDALIKLISRNIVAGHELQAFAIVLIRRGTIPKTSSGKIRRHACRDAFLNRELYVLREWHERKQIEPVLPKPSNAELDGHVPYGLASWVAQEIARIQGIDQERVDLNQPFAAYGLDSLAAIEFAHKLQTEFHVEVEVSEFFSDSTITEIIQRATDTIGKRVSKRETEQPARYPLSYGQRALWFVHQTAPESAAYNIARVIRIATRLDVDALRLAFQALVDRHPCLRTIVVETAGEPVQQVAEKVEVSFEYCDARDWSQVELEKALVQQSQRPFTLTLGPLFRTVLFARSEKEYLLHVAVHHMVADYWSLTLLLDEIGKLYQAYANKVEIHLLPSEYSYADYVEWQREQLSGPAGERLRDYWKNELAGELPPLSLPADHARPPIQTFRGASFPFSLDARLTEALKRLGEEQQATLFTTLLAAFQVLLYRLTSQKQVIVGCPIAGRSRAEFANTAGYFVNAVPLRADFQQRQTFTEFLSQVRDRVSKAFAHELYPFSLMVEQLGIARDPAVPPIFQSAFDFLQTYGSHSEDFVRFALGQPQAQVTLGGLQLEHVAVEQQTAPFDLTLTVGEGPDGLMGSWNYSSDLFERDTIARWAESFSVLLEGIVSNPEISVSQLPILSASEYGTLVREWNDTVASYGGSECIHELFEVQARKTPQAVAVLCEGQLLTYQELNRRANQLAHYLRQLGVGPEALVGVYLERSLEMVVALLGVLKAGGAYVPIDPSYPEERVRFMLADARVRALLSQEGLRQQLPKSSAHLVCIDAQWEEIARQPADNPQAGVGPQNLTYVIYTSGSTGTPKGVVVTHENVTRLFRATEHWFNFGLQDVWTLFHSYAFDFSVWELWGALLYGGRVVVVPSTIARSPCEFLELLAGQRVTVLNQTPSAFYQLIQAVQEKPEVSKRLALRTVIFGGEALDLRRLQEWYERYPDDAPSLVNMYGITETTVHVSYLPLTAELARKAGGSLIGGNIPDLRIYVLDEHLQPVPTGVPGEMYVAGAGLARGYLNRPELTAERFIADPFSEQGTRMYRTGDLARWRSDHTLEYIGRADQQVKIRGFRIELGEIEACLAKFEGVKETVVEMRGATAGDKRLVAYIVPDEVQARPLRKVARLKEAGDLTESKLYELPNGMLVKFQNKSETDFLYREIFEGEGYLRHGITLEGNACVFDIGANIGMFSLFVAQLAPAATIYAFEPIPAVFDDLRINMELYVGNPRAFNCGLAGESGTVTFTWYWHDSVLSGRYADLKEESSTVKSFLKSQSESKDLSDEDLDKLLAERLSGERVECQLRTLSSVIAEEKIERIDLLKIDVEKSELDVLEGIEDHDWEKIRQIVLEVHDFAGRLAIVKRMLEAHGYELHIEQDEMLQTTNLYNIYARQTKNVPRAEGAGISPHPVRVPTYFSPAQFITSLKNHLKTLLPEYMVPAAYVCLDRLPLTSNGKLDRKALPAPETDGYAAQAYEAPQGKVETKLIGIWAEVLKIERIGRNNNFFDLGGHSLLATQVTSRIRQAFEVDLPLRNFLENPTVAGVALQVGRAVKTAAPPLRPYPRKGHPRLSFAQERLWFLSRYETEASLYNVPVALRLRGALNVEAVKASLQEMVARHEVLRTSFPEVGEKTIQSIAPEMEVPFVVSEIREDELDEVLREKARRSFDLSHGPLIRASVFRIGSQDHVLLVVMHHIVCDGWSLGVMLREFNALYNAFSRNAASPLPPLPIQYADYSEWQREWLQGEVLERQLDYWRKQLAGHGTLNLPTDRPHSAKPTLAGAMETSRLPEPLVSKLKLLGDQQGVTLFMTLLAGFEILLYRYTGQTDISVGSGIANRNRQELEPLIGFFVNTLVLRTQFTEDSSVAELLQRVRDVSLQAYAHQDIPFERLVEALDPVRELSRTPFFQVLFALQNAPLPTVSWDGLEATASILETGTAKFDLTLSAREEDGELELSLEYRTELFDAERMRRLLQHYRMLLEQIVVSVDARIGELEILSEPERQQLLVEWNRTEAAYSANKCVHQLFEEQAAKTPQAVAVIDEDRQISYEELNRRANQLAHYLAKMGVGPEVGVGICMERGLERMVGVLGVLKAGGAYVALDPADPSARRSSMVKDAGAKFVLTNERFTQQMAGCTEHVEDLEEAREEIEKQSGANLRLQLDAENLAWVIYTSSSAGRPRGTAIPHCSAVSMLQRTSIDAMDQNLSVERWLNLYAPTEDTTYATYAEVKLDEQGAVTIGRSLSNTRAYVLDGHMKLVPVGIKGELYLGGAGQARGYLSRPELTAEQFVPNPFSRTGGERLYRTGDLVRYQENGNLEFLGRLDDQVKIQGYRIEPGEIEVALLDYPGVTQAAVITREDKPGDVRLIGYAASSERLDVDRLRGHLQQRVPEYMVPAALLQLDTLPLTANGKVDRKALIELESKKAMEAGSLALTPTEELIAGVWSSLLGKSTIRRDDNFFDLGGHSLTVIQMLARLERIFNREIELRAMFEFPVLQDFSAYVDRLTGPAQQATLRPIVPTSRDGGLPLSFAQQRLWFLAQMEGASEAYYIPSGLHLKGDLNRTALRRALDRILVRHEVLRTTFAFLDGEPVQQIGAVEESSFRLIEHDLCGHNEVEAELAALGELEAGASFDLEAGPLIRGRLIRLAEDEHVLLVTMHHIVSDGWSMGVLVSELNALYGAFLGGEADPLPELEIQYADYAVWQRQWIEGEILQQQAAYWKTTLAGAPALLELPMDHSRPVQQDFAGGFVELVLDEQLTAGLKGLSRRHGTTLYMTLLAGWAILLARLSGQQDVVIGSPVANRGRAEIENLIGFFVNTLALRLDLSGSPSVSELLQQTKAQSLAAQRHQDIPFEQVVELAQPVRSLAHSPLFQVMFAWQNAAENSLELPGLELQLFEPSPHKMAMFDLTLSLQAAGDTIGGVIEYASALFEAATVHRYIGYFLALLKAMVADDTQTIDRLPMLGEGEREQVLYEWNETKAEFPSGKCVHELFEEQVRRSPEATAVAFEEEELSYRELNARANRLAHYLRELGVKPDERVAICVERGFEMIVGLLAILKAGGAYVPLDPAYPEERLRYMLADSDPVVLLTQRHLEDRFSGIGDGVPVLDLNATAAWQSFSESNPDADAIGLTSSHLAYVIYTSGSTGQPKGVMVEHRGLCNLSLAQSREFMVEPSSRILQFASFSFDACVSEVFVVLCSGASLHIPAQEGVIVGEMLSETVERHGITHVTLPPVVLAGVTEQANFDSVCTLIVAGDILDSGLAKRWVQGRYLINAYGPTEVTVCATMHRCAGEESGNPPIGRPMANMRVYILDSNREPVPVGVMGELYIGGAGVARGYLNRPELTAERFVPDPFATESGTRMYKTGDLAHWLPDSNIDFVGRNDNQVKIRGFRIELGEIEARLAEHPEVREAVVLAREDTAGEKRLVAYYTASGIGEAEAASVGAERLRAHLSAVVPDYMVPAAYVRMESLPLTPNGKLDRKALPAPEQEAYAVRGYEEPVGEMETKLAEVWAEILQMEKVGRRDNFFELGGHSLLAVRAVSRLQQVLSVEVAIRDLFLHPELADLARHLQGAAHAELSRIIPVQRSGRLPLSFAQQRLWFLAQMEGASEAYYIPSGLHLKGDLNRTALRRALDRILVRHEVLRTTFAFLDGEPVQQIGAVEESSFRLIEHDLRGHNEVEAELAALSELEAGASFDMEAGPLIRGRLIRLAEDEHVLLVTMHHIVSDGWSMGVLVSELNALYGAFLGGEADPLPELEIQYADYAVWQRQWIEGEILQQQAAYWKTTLAGAPALLELPMDRVRPVQQSYAGAALPVVLEEKLTSGLRGLSRRNGTTLYMTLLAGWAILLARLSGQQDVVIGSPVANRGRAEIENLIGFFVNTLALRLDLSGSPSVSELLQQTKAQSLAAQRHQDIPFEQVVELAQPVRSLAHSPLFQVMFAWQNAAENSLELPGLELQLFEPSPHKMAMFDLTLSLQAAGDTIGGVIEYASALFEAATVHRYIGYFLALLKAMVADDAQTIDRLPMLGEGEREQVLYEWNETKAEFPSGKCVHELFEEQVRRSPEATAVAFEEEELSYRELNARANRLAHYLRELGVKPDERVAICVERGFEMIVGLLAILKAGGAYVPLDPAYPEERLRYMLTDSDPAALLTKGHLQGLFTAASATLPVIDLAAVTPRWKDQPETNPDRASIGLTSGHLAYVIYTSGSTGMPKGVMLEHRGLTNQIKAMQGELRLSSGDRMLQFASVAFDVSAEEIFCTLLAGAVLVLRSENWLTDASEFWLLCARQNLSVIDLPTRFWQQISNGGTEDIPRCIRLAITGGELVSQDSLRSWFEGRGHRPKLLIAYGPTEATINTTIHEPTSNPSTWESIGRPIANTRIYILDGNRQPVPVGVTGELYIGGAGVARGYLKRPELTAERFVADPFVEESGARMYRTGDLGRWRKDGTIEFLGRNDLQVKIRGFRIELGEIEGRLQEHEGVGEAVVVLREDTAGDKRLVAYVVPDKISAYPLAQLLRLEQSGEFLRTAGYELPNGMLISHQNKTETDFVYQEIFEGGSYLRHGITLSDDACVLDIGANIGMFTLSVLQQAPRARVYAFEPIPPVFESLRINSILSGGDVHLFNGGLSNTAGNVDFTWFKHNSVISGRYANLQEEQATIKKFMKNRNGAELSEETLDELIEERLESEQFRCSLRTLSEVIATEGIDRIDLLKIDVEKSELEVFEGIEGKDWPKIRQLVIEVHDIEGRLRKMQRFLEEHGYQVNVEQDELLAATSLYTIFARRPEKVEQMSVPWASSSRSAPVYWNPNHLVTALRAHLSAKLPEYMMPNAFVFLPLMPVTANGKIDRKALPKVKSTPKSSGQANLPPRHTERILTDIWTRILKIDEVGVEEKFFDVGGHSLLIPEVRLAVQKAFGTDLPIVDFFQYPTIRSLAERLDATRSVPEVEPLSRDKTVKAEQPRSGTKGFAIVGMACRFQDAANVEEFWQNLQGGVESITDFTEEELRAAGVSEELIASSDYVKRGSVVANADLFDARFFDISAREAEVIDPQQRIFLECAWEALENAGYAVKNYPGKIGLYAGSGSNTYFLNLLAKDGSLDSKDAAGLVLANANDFLATRVSYKLDLTGPSVTVQTACSTSLVAVHMACRALLNHECDMAMAGGITIHTPQNIGDIFQEGGIASRDGHCRPFDERAQGTVKGAGGGIVVIKRLEDALRDGDHIRAVIKGSAINNDGGNKVGYTAPSITGQCNVIQEALLESGVRPETITYLEAHGTATALGDPIEVSALTQAYRGAGTEKTGFCAIGSVKSNIGHADAAAGIAGLIKTVLALEHKLIPPTLHFERPNPKIDFDHSPFYVNTKLNEWDTGNVPRRAGVSSFGIGGTNAHVIVEEAPSNDSISACRPWQLVLLSAKTATALETAADDLGKYLQKHDSVNLADVAHTLQVGRAPFAHRCLVVAESVADTTEALQGRHTRAIASSVVPREACRVAFLFPGQGSQYVTMGKQLYSHEPLFRELVDQCSELLQPSLQLDLRSVLYPSAEKHQWAETELRETRTTQPALFVIEYALARVWMSWGLQAESMVGHSIGEYVAACLAGVFSLEDALNLVALRGRLMHSCERGGMLAVAASEEEVQPYLKMGLELAAINGSRSCVLTGPMDSLALAEKELLQQQVIHRRLQSSHAFHSSMMEPMVGQFAAEVQRVRLNAPRMRYLSNLTGDWITVEQATDPVYWSKQLRSTVQFAQALRNLFSGADRLALEVGPGHSNSTAIRQTIAKPSLPVMLSSLPDANTEESDVKQMLTALGQLWLHGADVDWNAFASGEKRRRIPLPTYPFERQRYWVESPASRQSRPDTSRRKLTDWLYLPSWKEARRVALSAESEVEENSTVLVFGGNSAMAEKLALRLEQKRYGIVTVVASREFVRIDHRTYAINPAARSDYEALFSALREQGQLPKKILHLWNVGHNTSLERDLELALYSPLHVIQAATAEPGIGPIQCMIVSSGLHQITGNESLSPAKATLLGLCKTIPWELPDFACKSVDIEVPAEGSWTEHSLLDQLVAELESKEQQPVVSYRGACRWIQTFDQVPLEACGPELVRERGVYLITGALNEVGFQFAEWLASDAHAAVVLVDPRPLPSREQWEIWPTTHVGEPAAEQITRIQAWEQGGAKVLISNADVADGNKMRELRDQVHEVWGKIDGVIHAAGFSEREPIASKTRSNIAAVLAPKIQGALVLDEVFAGEDLDFMVFCSSLNSVVGAAEQADCAAANAFLDSLARRNFFRSRSFTMSINWDVWTASDGAVSSVANSASSGGIKPDEAVEVLRRLLRAKPGPQAIISTRDLAVVARRKKVDAVEEAASATGRVYARTNLDRPIDPPTNATEALLVSIWTEVLGVSPIGIRDDFFDLGGDSLIGLRMTSRLQDLGIHVSIEQLFRHRTIQELAADIEEGKLSPAGHERPQSSSVLVSIQPQGSRAALFFVHPVGGHAMCYAELSQEMGLGQPFYGLQSPPANYFPESDISIEQMATLYNREIRSAQPVGPYLLSGWSMGGLVAWEMAQQLKKEGETIGLLALIDTTPPSGYLEADDRDDEISMLARFAQDMSRLVGKDPRPLVEQFFQADAQDQWKMVQETLTSSGVLAPKTAHTEMTALLDVYTRNALAMNNYSIHPSDQSVVFFRASETPERISKRWTTWVGGSIQFHLVPGDHFTMLRRPNVRIIAETLQRYISMNSNNESRAVSPEMSPRELIGVESQHTP